jgi:uncharacterized protein (TIGR03435 family)
MRLPSVVAFVACCSVSFSAIPSPQTQATFEVASVKLNKSGSEMVSQRPLPNGSYTATNMTLAQLVGIAYQFDPELINGPSWTAKDRFDVVAKGNAGSATGFGTPAMFYMLRSLLTERFKLVVRRQTRQLPLFSLLVVRADRKLGPHITPSSVTCPQPDPNSIDGRPIFQFGRIGRPPRCGVSMGFGDITAEGMPISALAYSMMVRLHKSVHDDTGLTGRYDFQLTFTPDEVLALVASRPKGQVPPAHGSDGREIDPEGPSLMTALREQLGLKLESTKGPVEMLVIDHAERPTED